MKKILYLLCMISLLASCRKENPIYPDKPYDRVLMLYAFGYVNLTSYIQDNINDMCNADFVPGKDSRNVLLVFEHCTASYLDFKTPTDSHMIRLYRNSKSGKTVRDTLWSISPNTVADPEVMYGVLKRVQQDFDAGSYNMIFSGHGTGWLPQGSFDEEATGHLLFSVGQERNTTPEGYKDYFVDIPDMATAIPMKLDFLMMDLCLMGDIESMYELRHIAKYIAASPAQVASRGFNYKTLAKRVLAENNPEGVCRDYFSQFESGGSATISLVKTSELDNLAVICRELFEKYRSQINALDYNDLQAYMTPGTNPWFFDLEHILIKAGASQEDIASLSGALAECVPYKDATDSFWSNPKIHYSGMAMSLPQYMSDRLKNYYKTLQWNRDTSLIQ